MFMMMVAVVVAINAMFALYGLAQDNTVAVVLHVGLMIVTILFAILTEITK